MSALFGFYHLDGSTASKQLLQRAARAMHRRGSLFGSQFISGATGLSYVANHSTEGSLNVDAHTAISVVADARIDNRDSLIEQLKLVGHPTNADIIGASYLKWSKNCPEHLQGDFAFAVWDKREEKLFCARDRFGLKQLLYHYVKGSIFTFSTDAKGLFVHPRVPCILNEARMLDFLVGSLEGIDCETTPFLNVFRLPPGHHLTISTKGLSLVRYWALEPQTPRLHHQQEDYCEELQELLTKAVELRTKSPSSTGIMASGGLDSSSILALAAGLHNPQAIQAVSAINSADQNCVETAMIRDLSNHIDAKFNFVDLADFQSWESDALSGLSEIPDPFDSNMTMLRGIYGLAKKNGWNVVLDGAWGDTVFADGSSARRFISRGNLIKAWQSLKADREYYGLVGDQSAIYFRSLVSAFLPVPIKTVNQSWKRKKQARSLQASLGLRAEFAQRHNLTERLAQLEKQLSRDGWRDPNHEAAELIAHPNGVAARERYDRVAGHFGIIARDPFTDVKLVEFCASLPPKLKNPVNGRPKYLLREIMKDVLPHSVSTRMTKEHLGFKFTQMLFRKNNLTRDFGIDNSGWLNKNLLPENSTTKEEARQNRVFLSSWINKW